MSSIANKFSPKEVDKRYEQLEQLKISLILHMDSYKFSHPFAYPKTKNVNGVDKKIVGMSSYGTARIKHSESIVSAGMQLLVKKYLSQRITMEDIDRAEQFSKDHFGQKLFARESWEQVVNKYDGYLPLIIRSIPEGSLVCGGDPLYTVTVLDDPLVFWMSAGFETLIQRGVWYPTTIATNDYNIKQDMLEFYRRSGANEADVLFAYHDFGGRGVSSAETAEIGGCAHTFNFFGSDNVEGILTSNFYYKSAMSAFSVFATEHSIECSFGGGREDAINYIRSTLIAAKTKGLKIVSIVLDGYDVYREAQLCCTILRDEIIASGVKVVFRPDSGDMMEVVPRLLEMQAAAFGFTLNDKGFKVINYVGLIQGDGVDRLAINSLLGKIITIYKFVASSVLFGSGGAMLQKVNRDTLKFAQKASALQLEDDTWVGVAKDPITDSGKKSKEGVLTTVRSRMTGETMSARLDLGDLDTEFEDVMQLVYHTGKLYNEITLDEIRANLAV